MMVAGERKGTAEFYVPRNARHAKNCRHVRKGQKKYAKFMKVLPDNPEKQ